jgi:hypothetical protein
MPRPRHSLVRCRQEIAAPSIVSVARLNAVLAKLGAA